MTQTMGKYLSLVKFSHTIFAMPFAMIGFFLAIKSYDFHWTNLMQVILCMVFARNAAMAFNRFTDRHIDAKNPRTVKREIPSGELKATSALWFVIANSLLFCITCYFINTLVLFLSPIALLVVLGYSYTKRFTYLCHFILGLGLALAPIGAYLAVAAKFDIVPLLFSFIVLFWVSGFDIIYALQDIGFDRKEKLKSLPATLGIKLSLHLSSVLHLCVVIFIIYIFFSGNFSQLYTIGAIIFSGLLLFQHLIVKKDNLSRINLAFFTTNGIASVIFAFFTILSLYF